MDEKTPRTCSDRPNCNIVSAYIDWYKKRTLSEPSEKTISNFCTMCGFVKREMHRRDLTEQEAVKRVLERYAS